MCNIVVGLEMVEEDFCFTMLGIGNRIRYTGEEIEEADLPSYFLWEILQRGIKRP
jgi:hypothetical protein